MPIFSPKLIRILLCCGAVSGARAIIIPRYVNLTDQTITIKNIKDEMDTKIMRKLLKPGESYKTPFEYKRIRDRWKKTCHILKFTDGSEVKIWDPGGSCKTKNQENRKGIFSDYMIPRGKLVRSELIKLRTELVNVESEYTKDKEKRKWNRFFCISPHHKWRVYYPKVTIYPDRIEFQDSI